MTLLPPQPATETRQASDWVLIGVFLAIVAVPVTGLLRTNVAEEIARTEKREAAPFPELEFSGSSPIPKKRSLRKFPREFEAWFNDRIGLRRSLMRGYNFARQLGLVSESFVRPAVGQSSRSPVIIGRDDWLFFSGDQLVEYYRGTRPFTQAELDEWKRMLIERRDWLAERGIEYAFVIAPNKHSVYPEFLPRSLNKVNPKSRLDQLIEHLGGPNGIEVIDLRQPVIAAKSRHRTFHKTDTHWNEFGAHAAYVHLMKSLPTSPKLSPWPLTDFDVRREDAPGDYLATLVDSPFPYREELIRLHPKRPRTGVMVEFEGSPKSDTDRLRLSTNEQVKSGNIVVLHDSFTMALAPYLNEHWNRVQYKWTYGFPTELIERERPSLVIQEMVERRMMNLEPHNPPGVSGR